VGTLRGKDQSFFSANISDDGRSAAFGAADGVVAIVDLRSR